MSLAHFNVNWTFKAAPHLSVSDVNTCLHLKDKASFGAIRGDIFTDKSERSSPLELPPGIVPYQPLAHVTLRAVHSKTSNRRKKDETERKMCPQKKRRMGCLRLWSRSTLTSLSLFIYLWGKATSSASLGTLLRSVIFNYPSPLVAFELLHCKCINASNQRLFDISKLHLFLILGHDKNSKKTVICLPKRYFFSTLHDEPITWFKMDPNLKLHLPQTLLKQTKQPLICVPFSPSENILSS